MPAQQLLYEQVDAYLGPFPVGVDTGPLYFDFEGDLAADDTARMQLRPDLYAAPVDSLTTENGRITISGQRLTLDIPDTVSRAFPVGPDQDSPIKYGVMKPIAVSTNGKEWPDGLLTLFIDPDTQDLEPLEGFMLYSTLIVTGTDGVDKLSIDLLWVWEGGYTR
jgi:hypothetical protein